MELSLEAFIALINQTGFPIAACAALFWLVSKTFKTQNELLAELKTTIVNNTRAIDDITRKLEK